MSSKLVLASVGSPLHSAVDRSVAILCEVTSAISRAEHSLRHGDHESAGPQLKKSIAKLTALLPTLTLLKYECDNIALGRRVTIEAPTVSNRKAKQEQAKCLMAPKSAQSAAA